MTPQEYKKVNILVNFLVNLRATYRLSGSYLAADRIRRVLSEAGIELKDPDHWEWRSKGTEI